MGGSQRAGIFHCPYSDSLTTESRWSSEAVPLCTVLDARAIPYTLDPTGRVRSGRIVLYGPVCENPFGRVLTRLAAGTAEIGSSAWVRRDDPDEIPLEKTKPFGRGGPGGGRAAGPGGGRRGRGGAGRGE